MIRYAVYQDLPQIVDIYNQAVAKKFQTADTEPVSVADRSVWFEQHPPETYPILVYEQDNQVLGWFSISPYRAGRKALRFCVEISYYLDQQATGRGIGSALVHEGLEICKKLGYTAVFAIILDKNLVSVNLMKKFGFNQWAHMPDIADFDGETCGHVYYGRHL
jgi:L-amino acid N-acyltransferase YncA